MDNPSPHTSAYKAAIREALPRTLSMLDREPVSRTFGCADRAFWSWKFTDFPGARFQEIAYVLADLATNPSPILTGVNTDALLAWAKAATLFWCGLPHRDGSFDEAYPYERSLAATAFTGFYVGQAFLKTKQSYAPQEQARVIGVCRASGDWLCRNGERHGILSNHLAAAAAFLDTVALITGEERFIARRDYFISLIFSRQSEEGWYEEYGGADPGYQTHTTFYLSHVWARTKDKALLESLAKSVRYFWHFVHADGSLGGEYASRNTRFFLPAGFEILAPAIPEAAAVAAFMRQSIAGRRVVELAAMDPFNVFPLLNNYCFARAHARPLSAAQLPPLPFHAAGVTSFAHSGHIVISTPAYQAILGTSKGGVISACAKTPATDGKCWSDAGVAVEFADGKKSSSQGLHCGSLQRISDTCVEVESSFMAVNQVLMSPLKFALFRAVNLTSMLHPGFSYHLKRLLVNILVRRKKLSPVRLRRRIAWDDHAIWVEDEIRLTRREQPVRRIWAGGRFSAIHMGSARYFEWRELAHEALPMALPADQVRRLNETGKLVVKRQWRV